MMWLRASEFFSQISGLLWCQNACLFVLLLWVFSYVVKFPITREGGSSDFILTQCDAFNAPIYGMEQGCLCLKPAVCLHKQVTFSSPPEMTQSQNQLFCYQAFSTMETCPSITTMMCSAVQLDSVQKCTRIYRDLREKPFNYSMEASSRQKTQNKYVETSLFTAVHWHDSDQYIPSFYIPTFASLSSSCLLPASLHSPTPPAWHSRFHFLTNLLLHVTRHSSRVIQAYLFYTSGSTHWVLMMRTLRWALP